MALATAAASFAFPCFWVSLDEIVTGVMEHVPPPPFSLVFCVYYDPLSDVLLAWTNR